MIRIPDFRLASFGALGVFNLPLESGVGVTVGVSLTDGSGVSDASGGSVGSGVSDGSGVAVPMTFPPGTVGKISEFVLTFVSADTSSRNST